MSDFLIGPMIDRINAAKEAEAKIKGQTGTQNSFNSPTYPGGKITTGNEPEHASSTQGGSPWGITASVPGKAFGLNGQVPANSVPGGPMQPNIPASERGVFDPLRKAGTVGQAAATSAAATTAKNAQDYAPTSQYAAPNAGAINRAAFYQDPRADADRAALLAEQARVTGRAAPEAQAAQIGNAQTIQDAKTNAFNISSTGMRAANVGQAQQASGWNMPSVATGQGAQIAPTTTSNNVNLGPATQANNVNISREDLDFRNQQQALASQTMAQAAGQGPSIASQQLGAGLSANLAAQNAAAASQRGFGNAGNTQRQLMEQQAGANMQTSQQAAQMRVQEQQQGIQNAAGLTTGARAQDIGLGTSQAGLTQQTGLSNQAASNQFLLQGASNQLANQQFNAGMINNQNLQQAQLGQQASQFGATNINQMNQLAGQLGQQNNQFNTTNANQFQLQNAAYQQQANAANQAAAQQTGLANQATSLAASGQNQQAANQFQLSQAQLSQQTNLANMQSKLQTMGLNDSQIAQILGTTTNLDLQRQAAMQQYEQLQTNAGLGQATTQAGIENAAANRQATQNAATTGAVGTGLAAMLPLLLAAGTQSGPSANAATGTNPWAYNNAQGSTGAGPGYRVS